ncbi:DNA alkylation repair protein [Cognatishimia sp. MH4019]|uniref:DNA alkylation repair protein n=1 Tax=Cognatishimia sp. MH4019 TaxID=2854030 RepID=UPI001CD3A870|nr:DNA alkylation repair protein [Cognatishimia sp. MH4019]
MTVEEALAALGTSPEKAAEMAAYHKVPRVYLGVANPVIDALTKTWRANMDLGARCDLAEGLWATDIHEARIAAAKLFTQARIKPDDARVWTILQSWVPQFDAWAIADHACIAGQKRLLADPARIDAVAEWTTADHLWTRRAALVMTLPWTKQNFPKPQELEIRDRVLGWAASYTTDSEWFIQKAVAWWIRELSKHDAERVRAFLARHGDQMRPSLRKEAGRLLRD